MRKISLLPLLFLCILCGAQLAAAAPILTADEIMQRYNDISFYPGNDFQAQVSMVITDGKGRTRERAFSMIRKDVVERGNQLYFVYFKEPGDIRKSTFLVHKFIDRDDDRWMYLPSLDLVKRIAASDKRTSFMGSHYFYEDVSGRTISADRHELMKETAEAYVIKNTPLAPETVEFSFYTMWINKKTFLPMKAEFVDKKGVPYRMAEVLGQEVIQGFPTLTKTRVRDLVEGGETVTEFNNIKYNLNLPDSLFSERYLRSPERKYLH